MLQAASCSAAFMLGCPAVKLLLVSEPAMAKLLLSLCQWLPRAHISPEVSVAGPGVAVVTRGSAPPPGTSAGCA